MTGPQQVRIDIDDTIAIVTLDAPHKLNSMDVEMLGELRQAIGRIEEDDSIRVSVLTGAGRSFCAGADLTMKMAPGRTVADHLNEDHRPVLMAILDSRKPWISAVRGAAAGIGSAYAMNCDLTVMAEDAYLYQAFGAIGLIPDGGATWHLANTIGRKRAYEMIATGEKMPASRCLELGLCNRVVPGERLMEETIDWARQLAQRAPLSLAYAKTAIRTAIETDVARAYDCEVELQTKCSASKDHLEGVRAFMSKRKPEFKGR